MPDKPKCDSPPGAPDDKHSNIYQSIVDLSIARRNLLIYPASHDQVQRSLKKAYRSLARALDLASRITLTLIKDGLGINDQLLDIKNSAFSDLAAVFRQYQIAALTISKGLEFKEFARFLRLMATAHDDIVVRGGIAAVAGKNRLGHVRFREVDYSKLQLTEESEILRASRRESDGSLWKAFVSDLLANDHPSPADSNAATGTSSDPDTLAALMNRGKLEAGAAIAYYERAMAGTAENQTVASPEVPQGLELFQQMIRKLNPDLQKQFLATTFDRCAQRPDDIGASRLFDGLGADLIVRMLDQANLDGKQVSPSLMAFINKVGHLKVSGGAAGTVDAAGDMAGGLSPSKVESLLTHEQYDIYVDTDYDRLLNGLTVQQAAARDSQTASWFNGMATDLTDAGIHVHAARAMVRLMTDSADNAGYRDWARQLAYLLDNLLEARAFEYLIELVDVVRDEQGCGDSERSEIAGRLLNRFGDTQFVAKAIQTVKNTGNEPSPRALAFLTALGEPVVLEIFDSVDPDRFLDDRGGYLQILKCLSSPAIREALERINDPRPEYVIPMIRVIRTMGDGESAQQLRSLLDHVDPDVRLEALAALLKFNNKWGLIRLRELLAQPAAPEFIPALDLAGAYRVQDVVPQLLEHLKLRSGPEQREAILHALGRIGDSRAIPVLTRMAQRRWSFSRKQFDHLKRVLYDTLKGYPIGEIKHLLHAGLKQKDESIQAVCRKLLREGTREGLPNTCGAQPSCYTGSQ